VLLAAWLLAPKAPVTNHTPQPQPVVATHPLAPLKARPGPVTTTATPVLSEDSYSGESTVEMNDVPMGYKRIRLTIVGAGFAARPSTNSVQ